MVWVTFIATAVVIVLTANALAKYGNIIAVRTKIGGMLIGLILLAAATSLPELLTSISSVRQNTPNIAAGNLLGSNAFNMVLLAVLDAMNQQKRLLRKAARRHMLSGSLALLMIGMAIFFIQAAIPLHIGWVGLDSLILIGLYVLAVYLLSKENRGESSVEEIDEKTPKLRVGLIGFGIAATLLILVTPIMVRSSAEIAEITGLGTSFIGTTLVAFVTSLPELVATIAAIKIGASDMAIGNLFGSNMFNMFALGLTDVFFMRGNYLSAIDPSFAFVGMLGLVMTSVALVGNQAKFEKRLWIIELDSLMLFVLYFGGMYLFYQRGIG